MSELKKIIKNPRMIVFIVLIIFALIMIHPNPFNSGVTIRSVDRNSAASESGFVSPNSSISPMLKEKIVSINGIEITNSEDYHSIVDNIELEDTLRIKSNKDEYILKPRLLEDNESSISRVEDIGLNVYDAPKSNLVKGLDLEGGTRVFLKPERKLIKNEEENVIDVLKNRLNIFGISDVVVRKANDLDGSQFILVEIAGTTEKEVKDLISKQGKFEAKIGDITAFTGGGDIASVCKNDAKCARVTGCSQDEDEWFCGFSFTIYLSQEAAERHAFITRDLPVIEGNNSRRYLNEKLRLYLDDELVDELNIGEGLKGRVQTRIAISGPGNGSTKEEALEDAEERMKQLQMVLITGALPIKLEIVKSDSISPTMGEKFTKNSLKVGLLTILGVAIIVFIRYKKLKVAIPMILSMLSEVLIILGAAAFIKWNLDLIAIAGIVIAVGTGVDDLIVFTDEALDKENFDIGWNQKRKKAFFIIMAAYFTTLVAMLPLLLAGAGLLKGFAFTTILGISVGVFVVRPAYALVIKQFFGD